MTGLTFFELIAVIIFVIFALYIISGYYYGARTVSDYGLYFKMLTIPIPPSFTQMQASFNSSQYSSLSSVNPFFPFRMNYVFLIAYNATPKPVYRFVDAVQMYVPIPSATGGAVTSGQSLITIDPSNGGLFGNPNQPPVPTTHIVSGPYDSKITMNILGNDINNGTVFIYDNTIKNYLTLGATPDEVLSYILANS